MDTVQQYKGGEVMSHGRETVQRRLRILQEYAGCETQVEFAEKLGVTESYLNNIMRPKKPRELPKSLAFTICDMFPGMTMDWLWRGRRETLSRLLTHDLDLAEETLIRSGKLPRL